MIFILKFIWHIPRNIIILFIKFYQKIISPDHSWIKRFFPYGYCKYYPSCSQYSIDAFKKHGFVLGLLKSIWRFLRCNPWSDGGIDKP